MFNFPHIERAKDFAYSKTFLNSVLFQIAFPELDLNKFAETDTYKKLEQKYPERQDMHQVVADIEIQNTAKFTPKTQRRTGFEFINAQNGIRLVVAENHIAYVFAAAAYKNFAAFEVAAKEEMEEIVQALSIAEITRTTVLKNNTAQYTLAPESSRQNAFEISGTLLNSVLLKNYYEMPFSQQLQEFASSLLLKEEQHQLRIVYGLSSPVANIYHLKLDFVLDLLETYADPSTIFDRFAALNGHIFDAFQWATTDEYKKHMG